MRSASDHQAFFVWMVFPQYGYSPVSRRETSHVQLDLRMLA
jgi:hypothetical protein